ncbi:SNF2 family helicase [Saccharata proteae CBS 121410]|uniref:SNF2 family helicase n=1 Tax=Saccharata proteae CBS 121410 TaxID=1314787 RepID=A0A9P4HPA2_9PEZI|nr:SNF2 family helicase [Saccharata proteae CBS 121410]
MPPGSHRKRAAETIDLTGDDDPSPFDHPSRKNPRLSHAPLATQGSFDDCFDDFSDDELLDDDFDAVDSTQRYSYNDRAFVHFMLYGTLKTKIVGVRFYKGFATVGEMVVLRREPRNPYDPNAIQVQNVQREQVGHIPRQVAAKLAKYIDNRSLLIEGYITGPKADFDCPMALKFYGTSEPTERLQLKEQLQKDRLPLEDLRRKEREEAAALKATQKAAQAAAKAARGGSRAGSSSQQRPNGNGQFAADSSQGHLQSFEEIIRESERFNPRNADRMVEEFGAKEKDLESMPLAAQPKTMAAQLLPYQLQALQWLLSKESPQLPPPGSSDVVQMWRRSRTQPNVFTNVATNYTIQGIEPELASGGILADDMGLGKTVEMISLIMADRELMSNAAPGTSGPTLIMSPLSVMSNWSSQIERHVHPDHGLRVLTYHGTRKKPINPKTVENYDVVVTTYETVMSEYWGKTPKTGKAPPSVPRASGLFSVNWRRVVLDEGHNIRNPASRKAVAAVHLMAKSRWVLTGTPIINTLKDLYSLIKFLRLSGGLDRFEIFNGAIIRPVNHAEPNGSVLLHHLMGGICLRRRKDMPFIDLKLPELSAYVNRIQFLPHEKERYDALQDEAKGTLGRYKNASGANAAKTYRHLLEILLRLRQVCNHWQLCGEERMAGLMDLLGKNKTVDLTPENCEALQKLLQLSIDSQEDCPICLEPLHDPVITCCAHVFGNSCIERVVETQHKCPMCRAELAATSKLLRPAVEAPPAPPIDNTTSSKVDALLAILKASAQKPGTKTIVFSQWTSFLDILGPRLGELGYSAARIDGTMSATQRDAALNALESDPSCTVMLASLGVCSVGLNLVAANQVILADSWWAPAIEDQAIDRVHRLGQKKPTTVFRLVMEGSIEEAVLDIQENKRKLMQLAFAEKADKKKQGRTARMADLERLLGVGPVPSAERAG